MRRLSSLALLIAATLLLYGLQRSGPGYAEITAALPSHGAAKQVLVTGDFEATVIGSKAARRLRHKNFGQTQVLTTSGVWVVVGVKAKALKESMTLTAAHWQGSNGAAYFASDRVSSHPALLSQKTLQPGLDGQGIIIFEIPESELQGATLTISRTPFAALEPDVEVSMPDFEASKIVDEFDLSE